MPRKARYRVEVTRSAQEDLATLTPEERRQVLRAALVLETDPSPRPPLVKRLRGFQPPLHRLRSGDYRLLFRTAGDTIYVLRVINRRDLDRTPRRLP